MQRIKDVLRLKLELHHSHQHIAGSLGISKWDALMRAHHYLGFVALVGLSLRYVAQIDGHWVALLGWASGALKVASRDDWIGWSPTLQWQRLALIANNSRFFDSSG